MGDSSWEPDCDGDADRVPLALGVHVGLGDTLDESAWELLPLGEGVSACVALKVPKGVAELLGLGVSLGVCVPENVRDSVADGVPDREGETEGVEAPLGLTEVDPDPACEKVCDWLGEGEPVPVER